MSPVLVNPSRFGSKTHATTYTGSALAVSVARNGQTTTNRTGLTWKVYLPRSVMFTSYVTDVRIAGDYVLTIDGTTVAIVTGVTAGQSSVSFAPASPIELSPGTHTFALKLTSGGSNAWYYRSTPALTGTGVEYLGWGWWAEPAQSGLRVSGTINFTPADGLLFARTPSGSASGGSFTGQTFTVTFSADVIVYGLLKGLPVNSTGYRLSIDGTVVSTPLSVSDDVSSGVSFALFCDTPVTLAAGTHTFEVDSSAGSVRFYFNSGTSVTLTGDATVTGMGVWQESTTNSPQVSLFYEVA